MLVYIAKRNGAQFKNYGRVLHDQAIYGVKPEGKLSVEYTYETFSFPDGETYELCKPEYSISEWYADSIAPKDLFCTVRIPLRHVGMGQMMALDPTEIEALQKVIILNMESAAVATIFPNEASCVWACPAIRHSTQT